jgi:hypothetical protein
MVANDSPCSAWTVYNTFLVSASQIATYKLKNIKNIKTPTTTYQQYKKCIRGYLKSVDLLAE